MSAPERIPLEWWMASLREPILVVGNGAQQGGQYVERFFDSVVRLNTYILNDDAGYLGTHWVTSGTTVNSFRPYTHAMSPWRRDCPAAEQSWHFTKRTGVHLINTPDNEHILKWFPLAAKSLRNGGVWPTTGFCFLAWLWARGIKPTVRGFDGMKTGHYYKPGIELYHKETRDREMEIIADQCTMQ